MIIAIDYDKTYTAAPELFDEMIKMFQASGHTVICVTSRPEVMGQVVLDSIGKLVTVLFASGEWKQTFAKKLGFNVDIWVDDMPETISKQVLINMGWPE